MRVLLLLAVAALGLGLPASSIVAKTPGSVHCYGAVCHRVKTLDEIGRLVGTSSVLLASYYDDPARDRFTAGHVTSSGETFKAGSPAHAASANFPDGTELLVWNPANGHAAHVRVNDFGPFKGTRTLDVTRRVAEDLGFVRAGTASLHVTVIAAPDPVAARYSRTRKFGPVNGFLGPVPKSELAALAARLIAEAERRPAAEIAEIRLLPGRVAPGVTLTPPAGIAGVAPRIALAMPGLPPTAFAAPAELAAGRRPVANALETPPAELDAAPRGRALDQPPPAPIVIASADPAADRARPAPAADLPSPDRGRIATGAGQLAGAAAFLLAVLVILAQLRSAVAEERAGAGRRVIDEIAPPHADQPHATVASAMPYPPHMAGAAIGAGIRIDGDLVSDGNIVIDGIVDGNCRAARIVIGPNAIITGDVNADEVHIAGTVAGAITARCVNLDKGCHVAGDVRYAALTVHPDARLEGILRYRR